MNNPYIEPEECEHKWVDIGEGWFRCSRCGLEENV